MDPENINAFVNKGVSLIRLGKYQEAIEVCDEVLELDPENANVLSGKGTSLMGLNKYKEAIEVLDKALESNSQNTDALNDRDFCLRKLKITNRQNDNQVEYENINNTEKQSSFDYYTQVIEKYSDFSGRSTRAEYWYLILMVIDKKEYNQPNRREI